MSAASDPPNEADLHAYVDGQLPPERVPAVQAWLATDAEAPARVRDWQRHKELIGQLYGGGDGHPLPLQLRPARLAREHGRMLRRMAAAALLALAVGSVAGRLAHDLVQAQAVHDLSPTRLGLDVGRLQPGDYPTSLGSSRQQLAYQLARSLGHEVSIPDLTRLGLRLLGGQPVPAKEGRGAVQLAYENSAGTRFALYLVRPPLHGATDFLQLETTAGTALSWRYEEFRCVLVGNAPPERLRRIAETIQIQLEEE